LTATVKQKPVSKHNLNFIPLREPMLMMKIFTLSVLSVLALAGALLEGLIDAVPPQFVQLNGVIIILCTGVFILSALKVLFIDKTT